MACEYADKVAAVAPVAGSIVRACTPSRPVSVYAIHGTSDGTIPFNGGKYTEPVQTTVNRWLAFDKCPQDAAATHGLIETDLVERRVVLALQPAFGIPIRLTVANEIEQRLRHGENGR